jgi:hypothetical protein
VEILGVALAVQLELSLLLESPAVERLRVVGSIRVWIVTIRNPPLAVAEIVLFETVLAVRTLATFTASVLRWSVWMPYATVKFTPPRVQWAARNCTAAQSGGPDGGAGVEVDVLGFGALGPVVGVGAPGAVTVCTTVLSSRRSPWSAGPESHPPERLSAS